MEPSSLDRFSQIDKNLLCDKTLDLLCQVLLGKTQWFSDICSKNDAELIWTIFIEVCRKSLNLDNVTSILKDRVGEPASSAFISVYKKNEPLLREQLSTIRWDHPELVDMDWNVTKVMESPILARVGIPTASFTLRSVSPGSTTADPFTFSCNAQQLQDLNWNVKLALSRWHELKQLKR